jgi:hypothetical protein
MNTLKQHKMRPEDEIRQNMADIEKMINAKNIPLWLRNNFIHAKSERNRELRMQIQT